MSYGFAISNDLGRRVIDESHGLYVVVPATVTRGHKMWWEAASATSGMYGYWYERVESTYTFARPYRGLEPPLIFMRSHTSHPTNYTSAHRWEAMWTMWYNNIRYQLYGGPGRWTGCMIATTHWNSGSHYSSSMPAARWSGFDRRALFMIAGTAVDPGPDGYGTVVYDSAGRVVFNSNDNFVEVTGYSNNWQYQSRSDHGSLYLERWALPDLTVPDYNSYQWISLLPYQSYRRYNGETADVYPCNLTGGQVPLLAAIGGRSGSPFHAPVLKVKTKLPISYTYT